MGYVNKKDALKNLSNPKDFDVFKKRYLSKYGDAREKIVSMVSNKETEALYDYIKAINDMSLSIGSIFLKNDTDYILDKIKRGELSPQDLESLYEMLDNVYSELRVL